MKQALWTGLILILAGQAWAVPVSADSGQGVLPPFYQLTSRPCPPFCVTPFSPHPDISTVGEIELQHLQSSGDVLMVDVRRRKIINQTGSIPGAVSIPFYEIGLRYGADPVLHENHLERFGIRLRDGRTPDFSNAGKLLFYDNGVWDGAALRNLRTLLGLGYPPEKLYWYRGGMSDWLIAGLPVTKGDRHGSE